MPFITEVNRQRPDTRALNPQTLKHPTALKALAQSHRFLFLEGLVYSNVLVGGIAVCLLLGTYALLGWAPRLPLLVLAYCATFLIYQAERVWHPAPEDAFNQPARMRWSLAHRRHIRAATGLALLVALATLPFLRPATLAAGAGLALISAGYMVPVLPGGRRLKDVWWAKSVTIAGAWAMGGVGMPLLEAGAPVTLAVAALCVSRFFFIWPNALLSDWPDRVGDARAGLYTAATHFSARRLRCWAVVASLAALAIGMLSLNLLAVPWALWVDVVGPLLMLAVVVRVWPAGRWFYGIVLDGLIAWPIVTALAAWG